MIFLIWKAVVCDQGSNLVRLFKEILNEEIYNDNLNIFGKMIESF